MNKSYICLKKLSQLTKSTKSRVEPFVQEMEKAAFVHDSQTTGK